MRKVERLPEAAACLGRRVAGDRRVAGAHCVVERLRRQPGLAEVVGQ